MYHAYRYSGDTYRVSVCVENVPVMYDLPYVQFYWEGYVPPNRTNVVVTGTVFSTTWLVNVTYFQVVWIFL